MVLAAKEGREEGEGTREGLGLGADEARGVVRVKATCRNGDR